ncbi:MAG: hypothetical protein H6579_10525 [Chitinophagales bacterium]|nr:hypothetical protein [Bacteroidota bacterium]MCB9257556.1 hypothetical protein [Chitinophagales bacterium]
MNEIINNSATALTLIVAISLPLITLIEAKTNNASDRKLNGMYHGSVLELPLDVQSYEPKQLEKLENMNIEMNGMLRVYSSSLP